MSWELLRTSKSHHNASAALPHLFPTTFFQACSRMYFESRVPSLLLDMVITVFYWPDWISRSIAIYFLAWPDMPSIQPQLSFIPDIDTIEHSTASSEPVSLCPQTVRKRRYQERERVCGQRETRSERRLQQHMQVRPPAMQPFILPKNFAHIFTKKSCNIPDYLLK